MSRGLPVKVKELLEKAKESCLLAVDVYNKPKTTFRSGAYIVLMSIAFTSLFHAIFERKGIKYYYKEGNRYKKIDGEYKSWELKECLKEYFKQSTKEELPIQKNIEFFIPLRNKIEHRFMPELDSEIFGECQALLHNFEYILHKEFGTKHTINEDLVFSLQFAKNFIDSKNKKKKAQKNKSLDLIKKQISEFRKQLDDEIYSDQKYSFKIYLLPKLSNSKDKADYAIEWINYDPKKPDEMKKYSHLMGFIKEKIRPISNYGYLKAGEVAKSVRIELVKHYGDKIKFGPSTNHHACYKFYNVKPKRGEPKEKTNQDFCIYDSVHKDYVYTESWVSFLINNLSNKKTFLKIFPNQKELIEAKK